MALISIVAIMAVVIVGCLSPIDASASMLGRIYPGGYPIALELEIDGAVIDEVGFVRTAAGNATLSNKLKRGDTITEIDGDKVGCCGDIVERIEGGDGGELNLTLLRGGKEVTVAVTPYIEADSGLYKLGVLIRDTISGVGTVTYVKENGFFAALGHQITDSVAGNIPISGGKVYGCEVLGVTKGKRNAPGEIKAAMSGEPIGEVFSNTNVGLYGKFYDFKPACDPVPIGKRSEIVPGKAYVLTAPDGNVSAFEADIIRAVGQSEALPKGILIRITDKRLLEQTGGIIQGMSGSPLLMNGKLVGAITHVLKIDPTKGYAIYIDWMQS